MRRADLRQPEFLVLDAFLSLHARRGGLARRANGRLVLAEVHQAHVASRAKFGDGLKRNLAASCAYVLEAADVLGPRYKLLERGNLLALAKQKMSEVPMCRLLDRIYSSQRPPGRDEGKNTQLVASSSASSSSHMPRL